MSESKIIAAALAELARARVKYPAWPDDIIHAAAVASEEMGEVVKGCNNYYWQHGDDSIADIRKEAIQTIAMLLRFCVDTPAMRD